MGNSFGTVFRVTTFGESHGAAVGVVLDGCPPKLFLSQEDVQVELDRRRPGQSGITTPRKEPDRVEILSGVYEGRTLGTPIAMLVRNDDTRAADYQEMRDKVRPSHADFTYDKKYGVRAWQGGGRASARETVGRVAAGAVAKKLLAELAGVETLAWVEKVHTLFARVDIAQVTRHQVEANIMRCPDAASAEEMIARVTQARKDGDSLGGVITAVARGVPVGLGMPVFDKLEADLAKAMLSLPAAKGFEIGSGFAGTEMTGQAHNDHFYMDGSRVRTRTNHSGGVQGGISNGEDIVVRVAFKPTATIGKEQLTVDTSGNHTTIAPHGRHDPCVVPRAVPIVEAMMSLVLADHFLRHRAQCGT